MFKKLAVVAVAVMVLWPAASRAQIVGDSVPAGIQAPWNSVKGGTVSLRAPGNMINAALSAFSTRQGEMLGRATSGPTITDQAPALTLDQQVKIDVINALFAGLNGVLTSLNQAIRLAGGLSPTGGAGGLSDLLGTISGPGS